MRPPVAAPGPPYFVGPLWARIGHEWCASARRELESNYTLPARSDVQNKSTASVALWTFEKGQLQRYSFGSPAFHDTWGEVQLLMRGCCAVANANYIRVESCVLSRRFVYCNRLQFSRSWGMRRLAHKQPITAVRDRTANDEALICHRYKTLT